FFFSSRRRHTRLVSDWSSDVCSSDLVQAVTLGPGLGRSADRAALVFGVVDELELPLVLDADALFHLGDRPSRLKDRRAATVLTRSEERRVGKSGEIGGRRISEKRNNR